MSNVNELVVNTLAAWNERDAKRRRDLVAKTWLGPSRLVPRVVVCCSRSNAQFPHHSPSNDIVIRCTSSCRGGSRSKGKS